MKTIILKLAGPMQAWGLESHFETRFTEKYPTKSAIVGLIGAALGLDRNNKEIAKLNDLDFAVRLDQEGVLMKDFHTARIFDDKNEVKRTYVTNRYYLQDAIFMVGISSEDDTLIDDILDALKNPYYQLFLGKRSLPTNYDFIFDVTDENVINSLEKIKWQAKQWYKKNHKSGKIELYADARLIDGKNKKYKRDKVVSFSMKNREYVFRQESMKIIDMKSEFTNTHDAFGELEE